jgi:capsular polysaccharide biosynthesis protein
LSVDPRIAARVMVAGVLVAVGVTSASLQQTPTYEASAQVLVSFGEHDGQPRPIPKRFVPLLPFPQETVAASHSRPVAEEAIQRLGLEMAPAELLDNLTVEQVESTSFIRLIYQGTDPQKATQIVNTVGEVSSEFISERTVGRQLTVTLQDKASVPDSPVSPHPLRNGLLTLVIGLVLCAALRLALIHRSS